MLSVALVNLFDPLPGDPVREGRYAAFARALVAAGHRVTWYTSDWLHALKRRRDAATIQAACRQEGFGVALIRTPAYRRNVGLGRLVSHALTARRVVRALDEAEGVPDVAVVSTPPPRLAAAVAGWAGGRGAHVVVDVQDLWPETFGRLFPGPLKVLRRIGGAGMRRDAVRAYRGADAAIAVAGAYAEHVRRVVPADVPVEVLHLGVDLAAFDRLAAREDGDPLPPDAGPGARWILVAGAVTGGQDWPLLYDLAERLEHRVPSVRFAVVGTGPLESEIRRQVARRGLGNVHLLGYQPYGVFCRVAARADFGLNHYRPDAFVFFPNRVFDYFAADLLVLNTVGGELADLIAAREAGLTEQGRDTDRLADYVVESLPARPAVGRRPPPCERRGSWVEQFDRRMISGRLVRLLETLD